MEIIIIDSYVNELTILESLYNYYSEYGNVLIAGDINSSCISSLHTNAAKHNFFAGFIKRCNLGVPTVDFDVTGENFSFIPKCTMLDYILFSKCLKDKLLFYKKSDQLNKCIFFLLKKLKKWPI